MIKHIATLLAAVCAAIFTVAAQTTDKVIIKNGSEYNGYISEQIPGKSITVTTESAILFVPSSQISNLTYRTVDVYDLPERLKLWVKNNRPNDRTLEVASLQIGEKSYTDAVILEKGARYKILSVSDDSYQLQWTDVVRTIKPDDRSQIFADINDVVVLKNGNELTGYVTEQILGFELRIRTLSNEIISVKFPDIASIRSELVDKEKSLWEQLPLLDKIVLNDGSSVEGFIVSRTMGSNLTIITREDSVEKMVKLNDIAKYLKLPNVQSEKNADTDTDTDADTDTDTDTDSDTGTNAEKNDNSYNNDTPKNESGSEVFLNGVPMTFNSIVRSDNNLYVIKSPVADIVAAGTVKIEIPAEYYSTGMRIVMTQQRGVSGMNTSSGNVFPTFTNKEIEKSQISYSMITLPNGNMELSTVINTPGIYVLYPAADNNKCIVFKVNR